MSPHLERQDSEGNWIELAGTKHNHDPKNKSKRAQLAHGIMADTGGVREVADQAGDVCFKEKPKKRKISAYDEPKVGLLESY
jgi:hypothetical protein